ncbi:MAG TPA: flagellar protein FliT [Pseudomonadales bacterium]
MDPLARAIEACRVLTGRMLDAAERGDWQSVASLDAERRACFEGMTVTASHPEALERGLEAFRAILTDDARLRDRALAARDRALNDLRKVRGRRHGQARYREQAEGC